MSKPLRIATRRSQLALWQADEATIRARHRLPPDVATPEQAAGRSGFYRLFADNLNTLLDKVNEGIRVSALVSSCPASSARPKLSSTVARFCMDSAHFRDRSPNTTFE